MPCGCSQRSAIFELRVVGNCPVGSALHGGYNNNEHNAGCQQVTGPPMRRCLGGRPERWHLPASLFRTGTLRLTLYGTQPLLSALANTVQIFWPDELECDPILVLSGKTLGVAFPYRKLCQIQNQCWPLFFKCEPLLVLDRNSLMWTQRPNVWRTPSLDGWHAPLE